MERLSLKLVLQIFLLYIVCTIGRTQTFLPLDPCISKGRCHECIQTPSCAWCLDPNFNGSAPCFQRSSEYGQDTQCPDEFVLDPINILSKIQNLQLTKVQELSTGDGRRLADGSRSEFDQKVEGGGAGGGRQIVQMSPQRLSLKLRAREPFSIYVNYTPAEEYPVDLYYLMDMNKSACDKEKLSALADQITNTMQNFTSNFRLGFGSFEDKVVMPDVSTFPEKLQRSCDICVAPYGFHHLMTVTNNTHMFLYKIKEANVSTNHNERDGGFNAIMQSVVCREQIGWRDQARRLLVFSAGANFHYAGDGKLGANVKLNDGLCHLSREGYYNESFYQDQPSVEQINVAVKNNSINVIFAATNSTISIYKQLAQSIEGSSVGKLEDDSSNIVSLIKDQYEQISSTVEMKHNASSAISMKFFSRCLNTTGVLVNTNKCENIKKIYGQYCECDNFSCERNGGQLCNGPDHGVCDCGECICNGEWTGSNCSCKKSTATCYEPDVIDGKICSGHGDCECGICKCEITPEGRYGKFCEQCPTCSNRCIEFRDCVQCQQYQTGPLKNREDCETNCTKFVPIPVSEVEEDKNEILCAYYDENDCRFKYVYYFDNEDNLQVRAQVEPECPDKVTPFSKISSQIVKLYKKHSKMLPDIESKLKKEKPSLYIKYKLFKLNLKARFGKDYK